MAACTSAEGKDRNPAATSSRLRRLPSPLRNRVARYPPQAASTCTENPSPCVLAVSRALGETMIVTIAAGATPSLSLNPLQSVQTLTAYIVQVSMGDTPFGSVEYKSIFAVGITLFFFTLVMNLLALGIKERFKVEAKL